MTKKSCTIKLLTSYQQDCFFISFIVSYSVKLYAIYVYTVGTQLRYIDFDHLL